MAGMSQVPVQLLLRIDSIARHEDNNGLLHEIRR